MPLYSCLDCLIRYRLKKLLGLLLVSHLLACSQNVSESGRLEFEAHRVAHAAGEINGSRYTNSYEALEYSVAQGFRYIELDFLTTKDGHVICLHDWGQRFADNFGFRPQSELTLAEFESALQSSAKYTNCTLLGLADWMRKNPEIKIITDVKAADNIGVLRNVAKVLPNASERVIPQVFQPENIAAIRQIGFNQLVWTLYRYRGDISSVQILAKQFSTQKDPIKLAITMPKRLAKTTLPSALQAMGIKSYVHTVNISNEADKFFENGITEIYTDLLAPAN